MRWYTPPSSWSVHGSARGEDWTSEQPTRYDLRAPGLRTATQAPLYFLARILTYRDLNHRIDQMRATDAARVVDLASIGGDMHYLSDKVAFHSFISGS